MNHHVKRALSGLAAVFLGWWLVDLGWGFFSETPSEQETIRPVAHSQTLGIARTTQSRKPQISWSPSNVPLDELAGIHRLPRSPALKLQSFNHATDSRFVNDDPLSPLADWLGLNADEIDSLRQILMRAAEARIAWESENLRSERIDAGHHRIQWLEPGRELDATVQRELTERFGDSLAHTIWIRGGLGRFAEPVPGWEQRGIEEIEIRVIPSGSLPSSDDSDAETNKHSFVVQISNGGWRNFQTVRAANGEIPVFPRLRHLVPLKIDSDEFREITTGAQTYPVATTVTPGMVHSPFSGEIIDVRGIPPGTLVRDPTLLGDHQATFRTPPEE